MNQNYYPAASDEGHTLIVQVSAANAVEAVVASSAATSLVASGTPNNPLPEPPNPGTNSVWTVDYQVPISGAGAPYEMGASKVAEWGQKDDPYEATAIFPPDEPMGWPAKDYKRAAIEYRDSKARTVNAASPSGAISTTEYNETNEVTRTLSPDNRVAALKEGCKSEKECKSAEVSKLLDSETEYNPEGSEIVKVIGPEHKVKLSSGAEVQARSITRSYYDEGAPTIETYRLLTKTTDAALLSNGKEEDLRETVTSYNGQENLGWTLRKPTSVTVNPKGLKLETTTTYSGVTGQVTETRSPIGWHGGSSSSTFASAFKTGFFPDGVALGPNGNVWITNIGGGEEYTAAGKLVRQFGPEGHENGQTESPEAITVASNGTVFVADTGNDRVEALNENGEYVRQFGKKGEGEGQFMEPSGIAVDGKGNVFVSDRPTGRIEEFTESGTFEHQFGKKGSGFGQLSSPTQLAESPTGNLYVADTGNNRVAIYNQNNEPGLYIGKAGTGPGEFASPDGVAIGPDGALYVTDSGNNRIEVFSAEDEYLASFGTKGTGNNEFKGPGALVVSATGTAYVADSGNNRIAAWTVATGAPGAHDTQDFYYTSGTESSIPACRSHPEWVNLLCQTQPAAQPETSGLPVLPVITTTYNVWDAPETVTEVFGATTRTKKETFDSAGRETSSEVSSSADTALPKVTEEYNVKTGGLEKQSTTTEGKTKTITSKYNTLGQLIEYTDADGNVAKYVYEETGDGRLLEAKEGKGEEAKSSQTYAYDPTTGSLTKFVDSAAGAFTASYDVEGKILTEGYPNGMTADYIYNQVGRATGIEYIKNAHCASKCPETWFSDVVVPSIHGETMKQVSTLAEEPSYTYDAAGRLTQVQEIPTGKGCKTRIYAYDEDSDRTSLTTREPGSKGECASEGGTLQGHSYDTADRLIDTGVAYETFGNTTKLPAADAANMN